MILHRIAQILDDLFGIPQARLELSDNLRDDWGISTWERALFNTEFREEFGVTMIPESCVTVEDYVKLVS